MDPEIIKQLSLGAVPPGIAGLILFGALWWKRRGTGPATARRVVPPLVIAAVYCLTHVFVLGRPSAPPVSASDWLPWLVPLVAAASLAFAFRGPAWMKWLGVGVCAIVVAALSARNFIAKSWPPAQTAVELGVFLLAALAVVKCSLRLTREPGPLGALTFFLFPALSAAVLELCLSSLRLAQAGGVFAAVGAGAVLVACVRRGPVLTAPATVVIALSTLLILFQGQLTSGDRLAPLYVLIAALGPAVAALGGIGPAARLVGWKGAVLRVGLALVPPAIALGIAYANREPDPYL